MVSRLARDLAWSVPPNLGESMEWLMMVRLSVLYLGLSIIVLEQVFVGSLSGVPLAFGYGLLASSFLFNLLSSLFISRMVTNWGWVALQIAFDAISIAGWIFFSEGRDSAYALLYLVQILIVSLIFFQKTAVFTAIMASLCIGVVLVFSKAEMGFGVITWAAYSFLFVVLGFVGGFLSEEVHRTNESLRKKQTELDKLRSLHDRIISAMPTGLLAVDQEMRVSFINHAGAQILGKDEKKVVGEALEQVEAGLFPFFSQIEMESVEEEEEMLPSQRKTEVSATGDPAHRSFFVKAKLDTGDARLQQRVVIRQGEKERIFKGDVARLEPEVLLGGSPKGGLVLLFQDVTKLDHLEEKLKQHEKLAAVGQLAAGIAHEIRNPLTSMSGSIELLKSSGTRTEGEEQKLMEIAIREIDRLNNLVSEFLEYVKPDKPKTTRIELATLISEVISQVKQGKDLAPGLTFKEQTNHTVFALAQENKIRQVIWNLVINAVHASDSNSVVTAGCAQVSSKQVKFWVSDEGCGMSQETLSHLYEPFYTTKDNGTGLGLATVYKIVEAHSGEIRVNSELNKGTRFDVFLPSA